MLCRPEMKILDLGQVLSVSRHRAAFTETVSAGRTLVDGYGVGDVGGAVLRDRLHLAESVGEVIPGSEAKILDPDENGEGEICVKGDIVMMGYYKRPELTAEVLRDGWFYTGDYGRFDEEGFLYICGRKKNVIVTKNGKNIFPEEIEALLDECPYIKECIVYNNTESEGMSC